MPRMIQLVRILGSKWFQRELKRGIECRKRFLTFFGLTPKKYSRFGWNVIVLFFWMFIQATQRVLRWVIRFSLTQIKGLLYLFNQMSTPPQAEIKQVETKKATTPSKPKPVRVLEAQKGYLKGGEWLSKEEDYVILDTETTGLGYDDEIIQLAIINLKGEVLFNQYFNPSKDVHPEALKVHRLSPKFLSLYPNWESQWPLIESILEDKTILIHNETFDSRLLDQTCRRYQIKPQIKIKTKCTMSYFNKLFKVKKLAEVLEHLSIEVDHSELHNALVDCRMCLEALNRSLCMPKKNAQ